MLIGLWLLGLTLLGTVVARATLASCTNLNICATVSEPPFVLNLDIQVRSALSLLVILRRDSL